MVQLGLSNTSGNFVVTVGGLASNGSSFTVSAGNIYFVATSGNDTNPGNFASPWKTPVHAKTLMRAGDTTYFRAGTYLTEDDYGSILVCNDGDCSGIATQYQTFIGYPGETATFGSSAFVISSTGVFTPTATGTATITATSTFGAVSGSTSIVVTVVAPPPPPALVITCTYAKASKTTTCKIKGTVTGTLSVNASEAGGNVSSSMTIQ